MSTPSESASSHIYSREDILALFKKDEAEVVPENLSRFPDVFSERAQYPVAFSRSSSAATSGDVVFTRGSRGGRPIRGARVGWRGTGGGRSVMGQGSSTNVPSVDDRRRKPQDWSSLRPRATVPSSGAERVAPSSEPDHPTTGTDLPAPTKPDHPTETVDSSSPKVHTTLESGSLVHLGPISDTDDCWYYRNNGDDFNGPVSLTSIHDWIDSGLFDDSVVICHEKERGTGNVFSGRALLGGKVELFRPTVKVDKETPPPEEVVRSKSDSEGGAGISPLASDEQRHSPEDAAPIGHEVQPSEVPLGSTPTMPEVGMHPGPQHMGGSMFVFPPMGPMGVPIDALQRMQVMGAMDTEVAPDEHQQPQPGMYMPPPMSMYLPQFQMEWMRVMQGGVKCSTLAWVCLQEWVWLQDSP
jgi:hypothetical protein